MKITEENIFKEAKKGNLAVLKNELVDKVKDGDNWTPLHFLSKEGIKEVLNHPSVDKVKDKWGDTPLHTLAWKGVKEVLSHPSVEKVKDKFEQTPLHMLVRRKILTKKDIKKLFPWYTLKGVITKKTIDEIINTPQSIRFIKE